MTNVLQPAPVHAEHVPTARPAPIRITPNLFAISFGLAGLAQTWSQAAGTVGAPHQVADGLWVLAGAAWATTLLLYARTVHRGAGWRAELADHVFGPFISVPAIVGMLLAGGLEPHAHVIAAVLYAVSLTVALALGGFLLAVWALDDAPSTHWHPGYYLPSVGAPLVAAGEAAGFGQPGLGRLLFGIGVISWALLGGILLHHLVGQEALPGPLLPTMAILIAPPVVAGNAWFAIGHGHVDGVALGLAGYAILMGVVQLGLIPAYRTAPFGPGWWSYSFPAAATAGDAITWLAVEHVHLRALWTYALLTVVTACIAYLGIRTVVALGRRSFLPRPQLTVVPSTSSTRGFPR